MREFKGIQNGAMTVDGESVLIKGMVYGDLSIDGVADVELRGMVFGNVFHRGGSLRVTGMVSGDLIHTGGTVDVSGMIGGRQIRRPGD